ncbi:hypothetical protein [Enterobacter ludwigii]|uniref:hypothetical protein n=1 Tax=Enterobacter ludwigii TaxID=299767 RepID=UPI001E2A699D|nr:hypothetical protein [Enterobacter ludwigii]MCE1608895.1 hypothetical protein [Enterobacter ludwigii]MCE1622191.1 hypothetical protein [Enterobacter ludwigii]
MSLIYGEPLAEWYPRILGRINGLLQKTGITGKQAEITRHYLLAALEIYLSVDSNYFSNMDEYHKKTDAGGAPYNRVMHEQFAEHARNFSIAMLSKLARENGVDSEFLVRATEEMMNDTALALSSMPYLIRYRLTECCYALEYPDAPLGFYRELASREIVSCRKYSHKAPPSVNEPGSDLSLLFIRAGLLFELKMLQRSLAVMISLQENGSIVFPALDSRMPRTDRKNIADYYKRIVDIWLLEAQPNSSASFKCKDRVSTTEAEQLLKKMSRFYFHKRMFGGTQGSWLGTLGAFDIEVSRWEEPGVAIYYEINNKNTISQKISSKFKASGFSISARNLYLRHKVIRKDSYSKVRYYCSLLMNQPCMIPWHLNDNSYYDMALKFEEGE